LAHTRPRHPLLPLVLLTVGARRAYRTQGLHFLSSSRDCCNRCLVYLGAEGAQNQSLKSRIPDQPLTEEQQTKDAEFASLRLDWLAHRSRARAQLNYYKASVAAACDEYERIRKPLEAAAVPGGPVIDATLTLAVDAMRVIRYPLFAVSPQANKVYYHRGVRAYNVGVIDEGSRAGVGYLWDETMGSVSANHVLTALWQHLCMLHRGERRLLITMDNCRTNKNKTVRTAIEHCDASRQDEILIAL